MTASETGLELANAIYRVFKYRFKPLGEGKGRSHDVKVSRWLAPNSVALVSENSYPNIWLRRIDFGRFKSPLEGFTPDFRKPDENNKGFHSNVISTVGFRGHDMVKFSAETEQACVALANALVGELKLA